MVFRAYFFNFVGQFEIFFTRFSNAISVPSSRISVAKKEDVRPSSQKGHIKIKIKRQQKKKKDKSQPNLL